MPKTKPEKKTNVMECPRRRYGEEEVLDLLSCLEESDEYGDLDSGEEELLNENIDPTIDDDGDCDMMSLPSTPSKQTPECPLLSSVFDPGQPSTSNQRVHANLPSVPPVRQSLRTRRPLQPLIEQQTQSDSEVESQGQQLRKRPNRCGKETLPSRRRRRVSPPPANSSSSSSSSSDDEPEVPPWRSATEIDDGLDQQPSFAPNRQPGTQLPAMQDYTPGQLFKRFFSANVMRTLVNNTNKQGQKMKDAGKKYNWKPTSVQEMYSFIAVIIFMGLVSVPSLQEYWSEDGFFGQPFAKRIMSRYRFMPLLWNVHISDPEEDEENQRYKNDKDPRYDRLFKVRPLYDDIKVACASFYMPNINISIDERMVASKARIGIKQYIKDKPTKWGYKLFVICDSKTGYTCNFNIYVGKEEDQSDKGLTYDVVTKLMRPYFGQGYRVFMDNFYSSPLLFGDLFRKKTLACGTVRENRRGFPKSKENKIEKNAPRGTIRWLRQNELLFVKWKDTREVTMLSTMHTACGPDTVSRKSKNRESGQFEKIEVPIPPSVKDYNKSMGGVDLSDQLVHYYNVLHKTRKWYKTLFYHFIDIAVVNSFLLYKDMKTALGLPAITQKNFRKQLVYELVGDNLLPPPNAPTPVLHLPEEIQLVDDKSMRASKGRKNCHCCWNLHKKESRTPWKCSACNIPLCIIPSRNCFARWHEETK